MLTIHREDGRVLLASSSARGFVAEEQAIAAQTRSGKQVLNLEADERVVVACPAEGTAASLVERGWPDREPVGHRNRRKRCEQRHAQRPGRSCPGTCANGASPSHIGRGAPA